MQGKLNKPIRIGIYLFAAMNWTSTVGFMMFPLSDSGYAGTFQDVMHMVTTGFVVLFSIASLIMIIIGGFKQKIFRSYAIWATIALGIMMTGAIGSGLVPPQYFGIVERFSVFSATGFNAVLGICLFKGIGERKNV